MFLKSDNFINSKSILRIFTCSVFFCAVFLFSNLSTAQAQQISEFVPSPEINLTANQTISDLQITGTSLNFSLVEIYLDQEFLGLAQTEIGPQGWQTWSIDLPQDLMFGQHTLSAQTNYSQHTSVPTQIDFNYSPKFPSPTLYNPVLNSETNYAQPWIVGLTFSNSILEIYIDEKLDGTLEISDQKLITDFKYKPKQKLNAGFHVIKIKAKNSAGQISDWSNEIIFEVRTGQSKLIAPDLPQIQNDFVPPVPAPTLLTPSGQVQKNSKLNLQGLVHNEHYVKIYDDQKLIGEFMPLDHPSGVTDFNWQAPQDLSFGLHKIWAECINPRGQISGASKIIYLIVLPPQHFVSHGPAGMIAAAQDQEPLDISNDILANDIEHTAQKIKSWATWWQWFILIVILIVVVLTGTWIFIFKKNKAEEKRIKIKAAEKHVIDGPEINYGKNDFEAESNNDNNDNNDNSNESQPPSPPSSKEQELGI